MTEAVAAVLLVAVYLSLCVVVAARALRKMDSGLYEAQRHLESWSEEAKNHRL